MLGMPAGVLLGPRRRRKLALMASALAVVALLISLMLFVPAVRDSDSASSAVAILLGAATATIVQLFIAPAMARQARRDERRDQAMIDMRIALVEKLGPAIAAIRSVTAPMAELEAEVQRNPAYANAAGPLLESQREKLGQLRDRVVVANAAVWLHFAFAADREIKRLYDLTANNLSEILGYANTEPVTGAKLDDLALKTRQNVDLMIKQLTLRLTGAEDSPL